ncbi:MAG: hypothetical protein ACI9NT_002431 [Bacteroidia bacterium]|jgi:hypothetical protein
MYAIDDYTLRDSSAVHAMVLNKVIPRQQAAVDTAHEAAGN